jgi:hypothetical protein
MLPDLSTDRIPSHSTMTHVKSAVVMSVATSDGWTSSAWFDVLQLGSTWSSRWLRAWFDRLPWKQSVHFAIAHHVHKRRDRQQTGFTWVTHTDPENAPQNLSTAPFTVAPWGRVACAKASNTSFISTIHLLAAGHSKASRPLSESNSWASPSQCDGTKLTPFTLK